MIWPKAPPKDKTPKEIMMLPISVLRFLAALSTAGKKVSRAKGLNIAKPLRTMKIRQ
jgi:hypothetical protein